VTPFGRRPVVGTRRPDDRPTTRGPRAAFVAISLGAVLFALPASTTAGVALSLDQLVDGLEKPTAVATPQDGSHRLFVAERSGRIRVVEGGTLLPDPFLDISSIVLDQDYERGLVGLAFHPDYVLNGRFFVAYIDLAGDAVVARYQVSTTPNVADPSSGTTLLVVPEPAAIHNLNQLAFGPDGYLYIGAGDGGPGNDPNDNAQNLELLLGKLLRIDVDHVDPPLAYAIPADNPFAGALDARAEIWAWGLRNPARFSFDRATGDLWIADVGQHAWEEVDRQSAASPGGENYGWRRMEGSHCFNPSTGCDDGTLTLPVLEYPHTDGNCAVMGGYRYRGAAQPLLAGSYLYADWCTGRIWRATLGCGGWRAQLLLDAPFQISAFGEDENGELTVLEWATTGARLFDVVATPTASLFADGFESGNPSAWSTCAGL